MKSRKYLLILSLALLAAAGLMLFPEEAGYAESPASLTLGTTVIPEGDDFATRVLGMPWDMNGGPYPDDYTALKYINPSSFQITSGGFWDMDTTTDDMRLWLHYTGVENTQRVLRMGDTRPVDTSKYKLLSYYMCMDDAPSPAPGQDFDWGANVYWMYDRSPHVDPNNGVSKYLLFKQQGRFKNDGDCELITFNLSQSAAWQDGAWSNSPNKPQGLRLDLINKPGKGIQIGWARLTTINTNNVVPLSWSNAPAGNINFYLSLVGCGQKGIYVGYAGNTSGSGTFQWGSSLQNGFSASHPLPIPESFEPGKYWVYMKDIAGGIACATSQLTIHEAPILEFQKPSFYSGPDYASQVNGDAWGMSNAPDVAYTYFTTTPTFTNGIMSATSLTSDPQVNFNVVSAIDTSYYRYATLRMKVFAPNADWDNLISRYFWWDVGSGIDHVTTQDMEVYEGWQTYSLDLKTALMEDCSSNCWTGKSPTSFRMDPHEAAANHLFQIDYMLLTAIDNVLRGNPHTIHYTLPNSASAMVTFYYDTDTNPANGRTPLPSLENYQAPAESPLLAWKLYLPLLWVPGEVDPFINSLSHIWDTGPVPQSTYYISADVNDGVMTTTWYSEAPVIIK